MEKFIRTQISTRLEKMHMEQFPIDPADMTPMLEQIENEVCSLYRMWKSVKNTCAQLRATNAKSGVERKYYQQAMEGLDSGADLEHLDQYITHNTKALVVAKKDEPLFYATYMQRVILLVHTNHYTAAENCFRFLPAQPEAHNYELYRCYLGLLVAIKLRDADKVREEKATFEELSQHFAQAGSYALCCCETCTGNAVYDRLIAKYPDFDVANILKDAEEALCEQEAEVESRRQLTESVPDVVASTEDFSGSGHETEAHSGSESLDSVSLDGQRRNLAFKSVDIVKMPFGRGMKATGSIARHECILREKSFCEMLPSGELLKRCSRCRETITFEHIVACDRCSEVIYCSDECRTSDWNNFSHETECGLMSYFQSRSQFFTVRHLGLFTPQGILDRLDQFQEAEMEPYGMEELMHDREMRDAPNSYEIANYDVSTNFWRAFNSLTAPFDLTRDYTNNILSAIEAVLISLESIDDELFLSLPAAQLYRLISYAFSTILRFIVNNFSTEYGGTSICLVGSMFNHNCESNAFWKFENGVLIIRASRDIAEGENITVDYGTSRDMGFEKRWNKIRNYYFQCDCSQCWEDFNTVPCVRCHDCQGPVPVPLSGFAAVERHGEVTDRKFYCMKCHRLEPKAIRDMRMLKSLWFDLKNASTTLPLLIDDEQRLGLFETIKRIISEAYAMAHPFSYFWLNFVYHLANAYYTMGLTKEAIQLGSDHTDYIMRDKDMTSLRQIMVLRSYKFQEAEADEDMVAPKLKYDLLPDDYMLNVQHLLFWTQLYFENHDQLDSEQVEEMNRFYERRVQMIEHCLKALPGKIEENYEEKQLFTVKAGEKEQKFLNHLKTVTDKEIQFFKRS